MMGYGGGWMGGGVGTFGFITAAVILIDLILVGVWLWKQINKS